MELGVFVIRVVVGLTLVAHGSQKLFGIFGGHGVAGTGQFFQPLGFQPGKKYAAVAGLGELVGGLCFALGLLTPFAAAAIIAVMAVAIWTVHAPKGFFVNEGGYEYNVLIVAVAVGVSMTGPGRLSLDYALGLSLRGVEWGLTALGLGIAGALVPLLMRAAAARDSGGRPQTTP